MRITEQEQKERRYRMLHTAYDLFCEHGIDGVSLATVAKEAGVSLNSIFRYFDNKAELLEQTQEILWEEIVECITKNNEEKMRAAPTGLDKIRVLLYGFENLYQNYSKYVIFAHDYKAYLVRKRIKLPEDAVEKTVCQVRPIYMNALRIGQEDGSISQDYPASEYFILIWGFMRYYVEQLVIYDNIYCGPNPWSAHFPDVIERLLNNLKS